MLLQKEAQALSSKMCLSPGMPFTVNTLNTIKDPSLSPNNVVSRISAFWAFLDNNLGLPLGLTEARRLVAGLQFHRCF